MLNQMQLILRSMASGDALCSTSEFMSPKEAEAYFSMLPLAQRGASSFGFTPGEATDDTQMAIACLLAMREQEVEPGDLKGATQAAMAGMQAWIAASPPDVGMQTRRALHHGRLDGGLRTWFDSGMKAAGNGSLMRAAWVTLCGWTGLDALKLAVAQGALTHADPRCLAACALQVSLLEKLIGRMPAGAALEAAATEVEQLNLWGSCLEGGIPLGWEGLPEEDMYLELAEAGKEAAIQAARAGFEGDPCSQGGFVLETLRCAVHHGLTGSSWSESMRRMLEAGDDSDTVACIAGALLGARGIDPPSELSKELRLGHGWSTPYVPGRKAKPSHRAGRWERSWLLMEQASPLLGTRGPS